MHKDTIVGIAGAAILVAAMAGVFWYEGTRGATAEGARSFDITFTEAPGNGPGEKGTARIGTLEEKVIKIASGNLTTIEFTLLWTDDAGAPDTFVFKVTPPNGSGAAQTSDPTANAAANNKGEITLTFTIAKPPAADSVLANSADDAEARAMRQHTSRLGLGDWKVTVELKEAGDATPTALPGALPVNPVDDASNAYEVKTILTSFVAQAK